jgi:hypothetical protein
MQNQDAENSIQQWFNQGLNQANWQATDSIFAKNFIYHGADREFTLDDLKARVNEYRQMYPDLLFSLDFVVSHGEAVGVAWTAVTKNKNSKGVGKARFENGKCVEFWGVMPNL